MGWYQLKIKPGTLILLLIFRKCGTYSIVLIYKFFFDFSLKAHLFLEQMQTHVYERVRTPFNMLLLPWMERDLGPEEFLEFLV